jgi:N-acyl-D-amino-acid deacylase
VSRHERDGGLLIRGGTVADGTGGALFRADVRIRDGVIAEVGAGLAGEGEAVLDAGGAIVTPGFIDSHTHLDPVLFWDPSCDPLPQHGVTTVVTGNCSLSLAPVRPEHRRELADVFAYIEDLPAAALSEAVPWSWTNWPGYMRALQGRCFAVNCACLVGHTPLRMTAMGEDAWERPATPTEQARIASLLDECMRGGAVGLSMSLFDEDAAKRPVPSRMAGDAEVGAMLDVLARRCGVLSFIPGVASHAATVRDVGHLGQMCGARDVRATWNGLFHDERKPERAAELLRQAEHLQDAGVQIFPQVSPRRQDIRVNWDGGMAFYSLAPWHELVQADRHAKPRLLQDDGWRARARIAWDDKPRTLLRHKELDRIVLTSVTRPELEPWAGRTLADLAAESGAHPSDTLADWVLKNDCRPGVTGTGIANADHGGVAGLLCHPATIVSNSDAGAHAQMMCTAGDTTLLLAGYVRDHGDMCLGRAVHELTARQASLFGLAGRGVLAEGFAADVAVFDLAELTWHAEELVADMPGGTGRLRRPPGGIRYTITAGVVVQHDGLLTGELPGTVLGPAR